MSSSLPPPPATTPTDPTPLENTTPKANTTSSNKAKTSGFKSPLALLLRKRKHKRKQALYLSLATSFQTIVATGSAAPHSLHDIYKRISKNPYAFIAIFQQLADLFVPSDTSADVTTSTFPNPGGSVRGFVSSAPIVDPEQLAVNAPKNAIIISCYWWGYDVFLPDVSVRQLLQTKSNADQIIDVLKQIAQGPFAVVQPFLGLFSSYLQMEASLIKIANQDRTGVIISSLWVMPAFFIARPWIDPPTPPSDPAPPPPPIISS